LGTTKTERYLHGLAEHSFLSLWSYGNPYTTEGRRGSIGAGKELCDLLVIFGKDILLFSDKEIAFNENIDIEIAWKRWYRRAVSKSADQLLGALKWLGRFPSEIYEDPRCTLKLPISTPDINSSRLHLICIANGAYAACRSFFGNSGIGSLVVDLSLKGDSEHVRPFHIGDIRPNDGFIHVFDEFTLNAVFRELDTAPDFIGYLEKREQFLRSDLPIVTAAGEEQLLASYLSSVDHNDEHNFILPFDPLETTVSAVFFDDSFWSRLLTDPKYLAKKHEDSKSRAWDSLIEHFIRNCEYAKDGGNNFEEGMRLMASEPRLRRRQLSEALYGIYKKTPPGCRGARVVYSPDYPDRGYVFLLLPKLQNEDIATYRQCRRAMLEAYCTVARLQCHDAKVMIGLATEPMGSQHSSEDFLAIDVEDWSAEHHSLAKQLQKEMGILLDSKLQKYEGMTEEYPDKTSRI
jgi:hypothetical protein